MIRTLFVSLFVILYEMAGAQGGILYDRELSFHLGVSVPTTTSTSFYYSPEKTIYKIDVSYYGKVNTGYSSGMQFSSINGFNELTIPLYFSYRTKPRKGSLDDGFFVSLIPFNIRFSAGAQIGYISGNQKLESDVKLNKHFASSLDVSVKFCYMFGSVFICINPEFSFLLTKNYAFNSYEKWVEPLTYLKGSFGIGYSF